MLGFTRRMRKPEELPFINCMRTLGLPPDPWQVEVFHSTHSRLLLNCCRQAGKSTVVAMLAIIQALFEPMMRVLIASPSLRQSRELFRTVGSLYDLLKPRDAEERLKRRTADELEFRNMSRILCVPCNEATIRGLARVDLLIIDEAARVPDDLYRAVRPMLAVSKGRLILLSTPFGKRGFFYDSWANGGDDFQRIEVPATMIRRIDPAFLEAERRAMGESAYRQEYCCSFESVEGLVYPDFARCIVEELPPHLRREEGGGRIVTRETDLVTGAERICRPVGGIDFGYRNPFAAIYGLLDRDGVLWLTGEHYEREQPLSHHIRHLPRDVQWHADPAGASDIAELRSAGFHIVPGFNPIREGISKVSARLTNGRLKVLKGRCPNLLAEAALYRWSDSPHDQRGEIPVDDNNHALAALRYLISRIDHRSIGRRILEARREPLAPRSSSIWDLLKIEELWTRR